MARDRKALQDKVALIKSGGVGFGPQNNINKSNNIKTFAHNRSFNSMRRGSR